jgi:hypothetical protein
MQLSDTEKKMIVRLQKQQQFKIRWRWVLLSIALFDYVACIAIVLFVNSLADNNGLALLALSVVLPTIYAVLAVGTVLLVQVVRSWNGKPETRLLLRLIEESQKMPPNTALEPTPTAP